MIRTVAATARGVAGRGVRCGARSPPLRRCSMNSIQRHTKDVRPTTRWILAAAVGGLTLLAGLNAHDALAQQRVNTGNARDANNRIGSGGYNDPAGNNRGQYVGVTGNDIVLNNVTGGKGFRGNVD